MKANAHPSQIRRAFGYGDSGFLGKKIKGSLKSKASGTNFCRSLKSTSVNGAKKIKPGVAFSIFTQDIDQEIMVSEHLFVKFVLLAYICV